jgi:hypothetical protein
MTDAQPDFREFVALCNEHKVEYVIVGGVALAFHGAPRFTGDLDVYVRATPENARRLVRALEIFGFHSAELTADALAQPDQIAHLGVRPVGLDLMTSITGVAEEEVFATAVAGTYGGVPVRFIGRPQFIQNKRASGRLKDLADLDAIGEA